MATLLTAGRGDPVKIEGVSHLADPDHDLYENGALLPGPYATLAGPTFEEWLTGQAAEPIPSRDHGQKRVPRARN